MTRHESLRTRFLERQGESWQVVEPHRLLPFEVVDLRRLPAARVDGEARSLSTTLARRPFDLVKDALLRVSMLRLLPEETVLLVNMHHIISDGWSLGVVQRELAETSTLRPCTGGPSALATAAGAISRFRPLAARLVERRECSIKQLGLVAPTTGRGRTP